MSYQVWIMNIKEIYKKENNQNMNYIYKHGKNEQRLKYKDK